MLLSILSAKEHAHHFLFPSQPLFRKIHLSCATTCFDTTFCVTQIHFVLYLYDIGLYFELNDRKLNYVTFAIIVDIIHVSRR